MKQENYPLIFKNIESEYLNWKEKDIFIIGHHNKEYHGNVIAMINDCVLEDEIEKVKPYLDVIQSLHDEYMNWYNSYDFKKASLNLNYLPIVEGFIVTGAYDTFKDFLNEILNIDYRSSFDKPSKVKLLLEKSIASNTVHSTKIYTYNGKPFLLLDSPYKYNRVVEYSILDEKTFIDFVTKVQGIALEEKINNVIAKSQEVDTCPPYLEDANFDHGEQKYVFIDGQFVVYDENKHSKDQSKFKKMTGE